MSHPRMHVACQLRHSAIRTPGSCFRRASIKIVGDMEQDESTHAGSWRNCGALHAWLEALRDDARRPCRTAVIVAHADDEVVGLGAHLPRLRHGFFVHVTNGGPEDGRDARAHGFRSGPEYVAARRAELESALGLAGLGRACRFELACPDQQATYRLVEL